jgi:hypothetical protein
MAEGVGFEPTVRCRTTVFKTVRLNRSRTPPSLKPPNAVLPAIYYDQDLAKILPAYPPNAQHEYGLDSLYVLMQPAQRDDAVGVQGIRRRPTRELEIMCQQSALVFVRHTKDVGIACTASGELPCLKHLVS